jgi:hypothetical protein
LLKSEHPLWQEKIKRSGTKNIKTIDKKASLVGKK